MPEEMNFAEFEKDALFAIMAETEKLAGVGGWEWDIVKDQWTFSDNWLRLHGCSSRHLKTSELLPIAHPDDRVDIQDAFDKAIARGEDYDIEHRIIRQDTGEERYIRAHGSAKLDSEGKAVKLYGSAQDITDFKRAEMAAEKSRALLASTERISKVGGWEWDIKAETMFWTDEAYRIHGFLPNQIGRGSIDHINKSLECYDVEDQPVVQSAFEKCASDGVPYDLEFPFTKNNGERIWIRTAAKPIYEGDAIIKVVGNIMDITELKKIESDFKESEQQFRNIADNVPGLVLRYKINPDGSDELLDINKGVENLFEVPQERALQNNQLLWERVHKDYLDDYIASIKESKDNLSVWEFEHKLMMPSGQEKWVQARGVPHQNDDGSVTWDTIQLDITERKKAEEEKERALRLLTEVGRLAKIGGWEYDLKTHETYFSEETCRIYGLPEGSHPSVEEGMKFYAPEGFSKIKEAFKLAVEKKQVYDIEVPFITANGENIIVRTMGKPLFDKGKAVRLYGAFQDITEQKIAQQEKEKLEKQLYQAYKMESIGTLAGGIAHDFNNILSSIIGFTELALDEAPQGSSLDDSLQEVYSAGKRAKDLVRQILTFARQSDEKRKPIQLSQIAKEVLHFIRSTIPTTIAIQNNSKSESFIIGNATQMHQALMNLCTNAAQAMENSGGLLEMSIRDVFLDEGDATVGMRHGDYVEIKVSDTGVGIAPDTIGSIFEPYFTTKGPGEGTGLGLAMVHGLIESYGGKISVDSQLGKGTTFTILLPIAKHRSTLKARAPEKLPTGKERILFVDDEFSIAKMGGQILERLGYTVTTRTSSIEALAMFQTKPDDFDLVITDMTMPNMTGDELAIELLKIRPDIPVVLCTGYSKIISDETASEIGIKAFAYKPVVKADLAKTVRKVLDEAKTSNQKLP